ncbi:MAG: VanW family protein [Lachnospiraceae bacterium]|nr:VanW family protein [Lachnospiraceae bacterium]
MKKNTAATLLLAGITLAALGSPRTAQGAVQTDDSTVIEEGVSAQGIDLSGRTAAEARKLLEEHFQIIADSALTVTFDEQTAEITPGELGLSWDVDTAVEEAASLGKSGQLITRYKTQADLKATGVTVEVPYTYDSEAVTSFVEEAISSHDTEAVDATLTRENGAFVVTEETNGLVTNVEKTVAAITQTLDESLSAEMTVAAVVEVTEPERTAEELSQVQDSLGTYNTSYSSSSSARKTNIRVATERLNGTVLMPGESLSVSDTILSRTAANGYELAPQYVDGQSEDSYGGGVCQVSTTLYNAVLRAELQVDERYPHAMVVSYVPYSSDAAIAEGSKDFIFTNDSEYPIYIAASADGATLTFTIYGKETRDADRTIEFVSDTLSYTTPDATVKEDSSMYEGETRTEGSVHPAVRATLTKVVYENGVEVSREVLNTDSYRGSGQTVYKGTKKKEPETTKEETKETTEEETTKKSKKETTEAEAEEETTTKSKKETTEAEEETTKKSTEEAATEDSGE